jgi:hypothetical protein
MFLLVEEVILDIFTMGGSSFDQRGICKARFAAAGE